MNTKIYILLLSLAIICQVSRAQNITRMEYFIDEDPGYGAAYSLDIPDSDDVDFSFEIDPAGLSLGYHNLYTRVFDTNGAWSHTTRYQFEVVKDIASTNITTLEWAFNEDEGIGNCDSIVIFDTPLPEGAFTFYLPIEEFPSGIDTLLFLRVKNNPAASWSHTAALTDLEVVYVDIPLINKPVFSLYPNPATSFINISTESNLSINFSIQDIYGNTIRKGLNITKTDEIDISSLQSGVYFFNLTDGTRRQSLKFIKI